jgi:hypothetical protein
VAVRFSADAQDFTRTVSLGTVTQFSVICWVKISTDRNTNSTVWTLDNGNGDYLAVCTNTDGTTMKFFTESNSSGSAQNMTVGTWYAVACSVNGVNGSMWTRAITDSSWTAITWTNGTANTTGTTFRIGEHPGGGLWLNGAVAAMKVWNGVTLTQADFDNEVWQYRPKRVTNLVAWFPFVVTETADHSGNGWTLSGGSGTTTEDGPPIAWGGDGNILFLPSAPTTVTGTLAGTLPSVTGSFTSTVKVSGSMAGTLPSVTGSLTGSVRVAGSLAGTLPALTGSLTGSVRVAGSLAGTLPALTGSMAGEVTVTGSMAGTLPSVTGSLTGAVEVHATLAGTLPALTGSLTGAVEVHATLAGTLPSITGAFTGTVILPIVTGTLDGTLPSITGSFTGLVRILGISVSVDGPGVRTITVSGVALERIVDGVEVERVTSGPAVLIAPSATGPALGDHSMEGPDVGHDVTGPGSQLEVSGVGM